MWTHWERSVALTDGQGIPDQVDGLQEPYNGITKMIWTTLTDAREIDPEKSVLVKAGVKLAYPETYSEGLDLEELKTFVASILRWLKMNCLLGSTSIVMQVDYIRTCLTGKS